MNASRAVKAVFQLAAAVLIVVGGKLALDVHPHLGAIVATIGMAHAP